MTTTKRILGIITNKQTADEAVKAVSDAFPKLSHKAAENIIKDFQDFADGKITLQELEHWVNQYGL